MAYTFKHGDRILEGYTVQRAVGRGGFGEVYYAISDGGREVALKYLRDNPQVELRGVSHCINLKSPHLVSIFDVKKTDEDDYCIIMEYCSGPSLRDLLIAEPNGFAPEKAAFFLREIAKGLSYLHDRGIVHRDLKPGNIFYDDGYVKIGDYGLAKIITVSRHSAQTASVGTVHYMAPEIGSGNYSRGVDIYALGVILYEMLMGTVPFEGSTMAEVLMKHLTSQPEVDNLPQPFGRVIRKALEKDPKNRYQTVDEMVEELLGEEEVERSLAGFSPKSLDGAVRQAGAREPVSPMPSPNPPPPRPQGDLPPFAAPLGSRPQFTGRARRRLDRIARKVERRRAKLAGRKPRPIPPPPAPNAPQGVGPEGYGLTDASIRRRRIALTVLMTIALSVGLGVIVGNASGYEEIGLTAGFLVPAMAAAVWLGRKATRWFAIEGGPGWARALVRCGAAIPLLAAACGFVMDQFGEKGVALWVAMIVVAALCKWDRTIEESSDGDVRFGRAIGTGFISLIIYCAISAMMDAGPVHLFFLAAGGSAGLCSLIVQASSLWLVAGGRGQGAPSYNHDEHRRGPGGSAHAQAPSPFAPRTPPPMPQAQPGQSARLAAAEGDTLSAPRRWAITRVFWAFVAMGALVGTITTFVLSLAAFDLPQDYHDQTGAIVACVSLFSLAIFALRKTTALKRLGFWRETLRPFLIFLTMSGIGVTITMISREWGYPAAVGSGPCIGDDGGALLIVALVFSSLMFLVLTLFTGRRPRHPQSFLKGRANAAHASAPDFAGGTVAVAVGNAHEVDPLSNNA